MSDHSQLKAAAEAIREGSGLEGAEAQDAMILFEGLATPDAVLGLLLEIENLRTCIEDLALALECEVKARYAGTQSHPAIKRKYDGDMQEVFDARALIGGAKP